MSTLKTNNIQHVDRSDPSILLNSDGSVSMGGTVSYEDVTNVDSVGIITAREGVFIPDSKELKIGNTASSPDLKIYHDTSNSYLDNSTGNLYFRGSNGQMLFRPNNSEDALILKPNGAVELYYDNTKTFETTSTGVKTLGDVSIRNSSNTQTILYDESDGQLEFVDNIKASFGTGGDLLIHHNGSVNVIDAATSAAISFRYGGSEQFFIGNSEFKGGDNKKIKLGTGDDFQLFHNGTNSFISNTTGIIQIDSDNRVQVNATEFRVKNAADTELIAKFIQDGACELYHNNERKLYTKSNGIQVEDTTAAGAYLVMSTSAGSQGSLYGTSNTLGFLDSQNHYMLKCVKDGAVELYFNNTKRLETSDGAINVNQGSATFCNFHHGGGASGIRIAGPAAASGANLVFANNFNSSNDDRWAIQLDGASDDLLFKSGGASGTERFRFIDTGGLTFNGDTAAANALDDYEEGTWTPVPGTGTVTLGTGGAKYTKIGRVVYCQFDINYSGSGSGSSGFSLPFNSADIYGSGVVGWTNRGYPLFVHVQSTAFAIMDNSASAGSSSQHATYDELNGTRFIGDFRYFIA